MYVLEERYVCSERKPPNKINITVPKKSNVVDPNPNPDPNLNPSPDYVPKLYL